MVPEEGMVKGRDGEGCAAGGSGWPQGLGCADAGGMGATFGDDVSAGELGHDAGDNVADVPGQAAVPVAKSPSLETVTVCWG
jgi:hypothetical protein